MKKRDIIQLVKEVVKENAYGSATLTTQGQYGSRFTKTGKPPGIMEDKKPNLKSIADVDRSGWTPDGGGGSIGYMEYEDGTEMTPQEIQDYFEINHELYDDIMQGLYENKENLKEFKQPKSFDPDTLSLVREMLEAADIYHNDLVDSYDEVSSFFGKRSGGTYFKFPHYNGPGGRGALFGRGTVDRIDSEKAKAKAAALKTYTKFKTYIEDYEITDKSPAGVYGNVYLFVMFNDLAKDYSAPKGGTQSSQFEMHDFEKKYGDKIKPDDFKNNPKLQPGKVVMYGGTRYKVLENTGYVLTLQSVESDKIKKVNLNQFISQGAIKEKEMKKIKEIGHMVTTKGGDTKYMDVDPKTAQKMKTDPNITDIDTVTGMQVKEEPNEISYDDAKKKGLDNPDKADISKDKDISDYELKRGMAIQKAMDDQEKNEGHMDLTNDIGKDDYVDDEGRMAKSQMYKTGKYAMKLHDMLDDMEQLPAWVQAKLTKASDYLSAAYHYLDYEFARRGGDNLMEHVDKYKKRAILMEGAMKKFFEMFDRGMTDEEVIQDYAQRGTQVPETFVGRARKQYEGLKKMKLELEMSEKEYKNSATKIVNNPMEGGEGMEEEKQLASGLFKENKKTKNK